MMYFNACGHSSYREEKSLRSMLIKGLLLWERNQQSPSLALCFLSGRLGYPKVWSGRSAPCLELSKTLDGHQARGARGLRAQTQQVQVPFLWHWRISMLRLEVVRLKTRWMMSCWHAYLWDWTWRIWAQACEHANGGTELLVKRTFGSIFPCLQMFLEPYRGT